MESKKIQECMILIFEIGVACSVEFPRERMNMSSDLIELHSIRQKLLGTNIQKQRFQATGNFFFLGRYNLVLGSTPHHMI